MAFYRTDKMSLEDTLAILNLARNVYPAAVLVIFLVAFVVFGVVNSPVENDRVLIDSLRGPGGRPLPTRRKSNNQVREAVAVRDFSPRAKTVFAMLQAVVLATFVADGVAVILQVISGREDHWWPGQSAVVFVVGSFFLWVVAFVSIIDTKPSPTWVHLLTWSVAIPMEVIILGSLLTIYGQPHHEPVVGDQTGGRLRQKITAWELFQVVDYLVRTLLLIGLVVTYLAVKFALNFRSSASTQQDSEVIQPLLNGQADTHKSNGNGNGHAYGTTQTSSPHPHHEEQQDAWAKPKQAPEMTWYSYIRGFAVLLPYLWPRKSLKLQAIATICFLCMVGQRVINVFVPIYTGKITDALQKSQTGRAYTPWFLIAVYIAFRYLQGGQGLLAAVRTVLWTPVEQYSFRAISSAAFEHVHNLSADFHNNKRTGELISALNKGSSINTFLELVTFNVGPMIFDLVVAIIFLASKFDIYISLSLAIVTFLYIYVTIRIAAWRVALRRKYTNSDREMEAVKNDSLHSWDTVKYFNAEDYEFNRYRKAIRTMQGFEWMVNLSLGFMNTIQGIIFIAGLLSVCYIEAYQVTAGYQGVGDFVTLVFYMSQLQQPLNFFGTFYRTVQNNLINAERMLELFKEQPNVVDSPDAEPLMVCNGDIVFDAVSFGYDERKQALSGVTFRCAPGTTTALVGESGGGKSTIMRMIFRYYNPTSGRILVDGHDVQDITIDSLRKFIGVVPQDCNMFNESIMYNLKYANQDATEEEIYDACRAASIHERILQFADGYDTKVGERGVKLSGGERQRVAIARTILKNPKITLLDEATAALDTETEERIQHAFKSLAEGRTMLIIAHRLSTITEADQILVLSGGTIVEKGTHQDLLDSDGRYASMWRKQIRAQKAAVEADLLRAKAERAIKEAAESESLPVSEDEAEQAKDKSITRVKSEAAKKGHKRVNFSQSSLSHGWTADDEGGSKSGGFHG